MKSWDFSNLKTPFRCRLTGLYTALLIFQAEEVNRRE